jgi:hypothetical protein
MATANGANDEHQVGADGSGTESAGRARSESFSQQSQTSQTAAE